MKPLAFTKGDHVDGDSDTESDSTNGDESVDRDVNSEFQ